MLLDSSQSANSILVRSGSSNSGRVEMWRGSIRFDLSVSVPFV